MGALPGSWERRQRRAARFAPEAALADIPPGRQGFRHPLETEEHELCIMSWPTRTRTDFWRGHLGGARDAWAEVARTVSRYEPVLMVADVGEGRMAEGWIDCAEVEVVEIPIDDSWSRDTAPVFLRNERGDRVAVDFEFNAWGGKHEPWNNDASMGAALCDYLGVQRYEAPLVLEGGSVVSDGQGTVITTERCLLNPNRNPSLSRDEIEAALGDWLGAERVIWLPNGLADDWYTDGHVDNVVAFVRPGMVVLQSTIDESDDDYAIAETNREILEAAGLEVRELDVLPHARCFHETVEVPYVNFYPANGAIIVPVGGVGADYEMLERLSVLYPDREIVSVPGEVIAYGGGGVHCITQPLPRLG
jgi:agmatine deiminase